jgi:capsular polysaccharide transport system ATP-binding protein
MIRLDGVTVRYRRSSGAHPVLENVSAAFEPRRNTGILGQRGTGKSTLIKLLGRLTRPDGGRVMHDGSVSWPLTSQRTFLMTVSIRKNIRFIAKLYRSHAPELIRLVDRMAGLGTMLDTPIRDLPREVRARATYSLCLALGFDYYIADEALFIGDPEFREGCRFYLQRMRHRRALIIATGHPNIIREHCDVVYILHAATLRRFDDTREAIRAFRAL